MEEAITDIVAKPIEALTSMAFKKSKFAMSKDLDNTIERLEFFFCCIKATLQNVDPFEASNDIERMKIERLQFIHDEINCFFTKLAARAGVQREVIGSRGFTAKVCSFLSSPKQYLSRFKYAAKVNDLTSKLKSLASDIELYKRIAIDPFRNHNLQTPSEDTSHFPETDVFIGRDTDKKNIINLLCNYSVVAIVGVGGQGKTTLAQFVCQDDWVKGSFDLLLWVSVTLHSSIKEILEKIIASATRVKPINCGLQELQQQVLEALVGKKCLLVLDNVSYVDNLRDDSEKLNAILKLGGFWGNGGKVLITTRSKAAAKFMDTIELYELRDLAEDDCWTLLRSYAIKQEDKKESGVEEIGKDIAKMCPKIPLVLKTIGRYLADNDHKIQWEHFKNQLASNPTVYMSKDGNIKQILKLCYDQLDYNLKRCAAFCSLFPKGHEYGKHYMVRNWIALGFVEPREGMSLEDVGDAYVLELTQRAFLEEVSGYGVFKMHDVMHDLMRLIGKDKHQMIDSKTKDIDEGVRHVSLNMQDLNWEVLLSSINGKQTLESIILVSSTWGNRVRGVRLGSKIDRLISACQKLKVLEIYEQEIKQVPSSIGKLTLVRHLNLSQNPLFELPDEITKMGNLLTLDLSKCGNLQKLPRKMGKLVNLESLKLCNCENLQELPGDMGKLVKLRVLLVRGCKLRCMPKGFGNLTKLERLDVFVVGESSRSSRGSKGKVGAKLEELSHLKNLEGRLCIKVAGQSTYIVSEAGNAHLEMEAKLSSLDIVFEKKVEEDEKFLEGIQFCGENLKSLKIWDYGGKRLPAWMTDDGFHKRFPNLSRLFFEQSKVKNMNPYLELVSDEHMWFGIEGNEDDLEWIPRYSKIKEQLKMGPMQLDFTTRRDELKLITHLSDLALNEVCFSITKELAPRSGCDFGGQRQPDFLFKSCFPNLTELTLSDIPELEVLPEEFQGLSFLVRLSILECPKLKAIPNWIDSLSSLKYLKIKDAPELKVLPESIGSLTSLSELELVDCRGLELLLHQMSNLPYPCRLRIDRCSKALFEKCERPTGEYWPHLQHLRHVSIKSFEGDKSQRRKDRVILLKDQSKNGNGKARYTPLPPNIWKSIRESTLLPRWKEFLCKLLNEDLPTTEYWAKRGYVVDQCCKLCGQGIDSADHIFRTCVFARHIWQCSILGIISDSDPQFTLEFWVANYLQCLSREDVTWGYRVPIFTSVLWALWIHRDEVVVENATPNPTHIMNLATKWYTIWQITRQRFMMQKMKRLQFKR